MEQIRLQKYLAMCNVASRRASEKLIEDGRVTVNGKVVNVLGSKVSEGDVVCVDGIKTECEKKKYYIMLNKPAGFVTTVSDENGRDTVMSLTDDISARLYPVGRLDYNTEGLLLMSNDGDFTYKITHPKHKLSKVYIAVVKGTPTRFDIEKLKSGVVIDGKKTAPAKVRALRAESGNCELEIIICEGRNRQVRKMCEAVGYPVLYLKRVQIGPVILGNLPMGRWRHLNPNEVEALINAAQNK